MRLTGQHHDRSRTKNLHELLSEPHGLNVTYQPMDIVGLTASVSIARELERCRDEGFRGVNVTHPYKLDAFAHAKPIELCLFVCCLSHTRSALGDGDHHAHMVH